MNRQGARRKEKGKMANYCEFKGILKGRKNACYAAYGCFEVYDDKRIVKEYGTNEDYFLQFEGNCQWSIQHYSYSRENSKPIAIPEDPEKAFEYAEENYQDLSLADICQLFQVELLCNWGVFELSNQATFEHYIRNIKVNSYCPDELRFEKERPWTPYAQEAYKYRLDNPEKLTQMRFLNIRGRIFSISGYPDVEKASFRKEIEARGGTLADGLPNETFCLIVNPAYPGVTNKYLNAIYRYESCITPGESRGKFCCCIITGDRFRELLDQTGSNIKNPTAEDLTILYRRHGEKRNYMLVDAPSGAQTLDLSQCDLDTISEDALTSCTQLRKVILPAKCLSIYNSFTNCPIEQVISPSVQDLTPQMFKNGKIPWIDIPLLPSYELDTKDKILYGCLRYVRAVKQGEDVSQVREGFDQLLLAKKRTLLAQPEWKEYAEYFRNNGMLTKTDIKNLSDLAAAAGDSDFLHILENTKGSTVPKDATWKIKEIFGGIRILQYRGLETDVTVPRMLTGRLVLEIDADAFSPNAPGLTLEMQEARRSLKRLALPDTIQAELFSALEKCTSLEILDFPNGYPKGNRWQSKIGRIMVRLRSFQIPNELYAKDSLFYKFEGSSFAVPDGVQELGAFEFAGSELETISLPNSLRKIDEGAFHKCSKLKRVVLPDGVLEIGECAFVLCTSLEEIIIPESVKILAENAFWGCSNLERVRIPGGTELVGHLEWISNSSFRRGESDDSGFIRIITTRNSPAARYAKERGIPLIIKPK